MPTIKLTTKKPAVEVDEFDLIKEILERMVSAMGQQKVLSLSDDMIRQIKGEIGNMGEQGIQGESGFKGDQGIQGVSGKDGRIGLMGRDGKIGKAGKDGKKGDSGKDGSPDDPDDIAKKLNTLDEKVNISVIKGLEKQMRSLQRSIQDRKGGGGGGGMGMPVHQTFTGDDSATSFPLSNNVAAGGKAAWVYMNGQFLVNSTHWSISGKTLTLTLTPTTDEIIDITYIRSG